MANISTINLPIVDYDTVDDILVNGNGTTGRIKKVSLLKKIGDWSSITNKPFDNIEQLYFRTNEDDYGNNILTLSDDIIAAIQKVNTLSTSIEDLQENKHSHTNFDVINKFNVNNDNKLMWNDIVVGSDYTLPIATTTELGGVKVDGSSITIDDNGVIHGANTYTLPVATKDNIGGVKPDGKTLSVEDDGTLQVVNSAGISEWEQNTDYEVGNIVFNEVTIYKCIENHTSTDTFDATKWLSFTGEKGNVGEQGFSPITTVEQTDTGVKISITDAYGTTTGTLSNGIDGKDGTNGTDGITPHIDDNNNHWFIGETDTGVVAKGTTKVITSAVIYSGTLLVNGWAGDIAPYTQTVSFEGITEQARPYVNLKISDDITTGIEEMNQWSYITKAKTTDGQIVFYCYQNKPTIDLNFEAEVR